MKVSRLICYSIVPKVPFLFTYLELPRGIYYLLIDLISVGDRSVHSYSWDVLNCLLTNTINRAYSAPLLSWRQWVIRFTYSQTLIVGFFSLFNSPKSSMLKKIDISKFPAQVSSSELTALKKKTVTGVQYAGDFLHVVSQDSDVCITHSI